jgi:transcriptional regulator
MFDDRDAPEAPPPGGPAEPGAPPGRSELLPGTLDLLILHTLSLGAMHGYAVAQHIERLSDAVLRVEQGSLYPALDRLQRKGWVTSEWGETPTKRRARYYTLTTAGRKQLGQELSRYDRVSLAIARILGRA